MDNRKTHFDRIYKNNSWGRYGNTLSGRGSSDLFVKNDIEYIVSIIDKYQIKSIVDVCGDFAWQEGFLKDYSGSYLGIDVSQECLNRIKNNKYSFRQLDICVDPIPGCDLLIVRDVLFHLEDNDIHSFLKNLLLSNVKLLMVTTFLEQKDDTNFQEQKVRASKHNLTLPPFNLKLEDLYAGNKNVKGYENKYLGILKMEKYYESLDE